MIELLPKRRLTTSLSVRQWFCLAVAAAFLSGCAAAGPKYLNLTYTAPAQFQDRNQTLGLSRFNDRRINMDKGYVGFRQLMGDKQEIFVVTGQDLASAMTRVTRSFLEHKGFSVSLIPSWPATAPGVSRMAGQFDHVLAAEIHQFECRAVKKGPATEMILSIDLTFHLGTPDKRQLTTIPIVLTLERTELMFSRKKLEAFVNEAIDEIFIKALSLSYF
ncbi:MAG: hypothetical protein ACNA7H_06195 [Desulfotignum sp.]